MDDGSDRRFAAHGFEGVGSPAGRTAPGTGGRRPRWLPLIALPIGVALMTGCMSGPDALEHGGASVSGGSSPATDGMQRPVAPIGDPVAIASGLAAPWSILRLTNGATLVSERDEAQIVELVPDVTDKARTVTRVPGVFAEGEGGLLGLAEWVDDASSDTWIYAYLTTEQDNRVIRMPLTGDPGSLALAAPDVVFSGIPRAANHDGGRIAFGPDGMLYVCAGDANRSDAAQDPDALGGKILRLTPTGDVPADNTSGTAVWSLGHRNPQGLAWDSTGRLWAAEFGQNTWDELNLIEEGGNYGWPIVEGGGDAAESASDSGAGAVAGAVAGAAVAAISTDSDSGVAIDADGFVDPVVQWPTDAASPSGLAIVDDTLFLAGLGGQRLWRISGEDDTWTADEWFAGDYGRIRDAVPGPDGTLWIATNNTDGRGSPRPGDDRIYEVELGQIGG